MASLRDLADVLWRAVHLLGLTLVPWALSPEPAPPGNPALAAVIAVLALAAVLFAAARFRAAVPSPYGRAAAFLVWASVAASIALGLVFRGARAPLGRGVLWLAPALWLAVAALAAAAADRWLAPWKARARVAAIIPLALGAISIAAASRWIAAPESMWWEALDRDNGHPLAAVALAAPALDAHRYDDARRVASRCLAQHPSACACLEERAEIEIAAGAPQIAVPAARSALAACPGRPTTRALLAEALALTGDTAAAEQEARLGLDQGGSEPRLRYALALALQRSGRAGEAREELDRALAAGAGRNARLLAGALAIDAGDLDQGERLLAPLGSPTAADPAASYDLALIADRRGDYNRAREGYIAVTRADPQNADARYNLALLTWRNGVVDEAHHHAQHFIQFFPADPRGAELVRTVATPPPKRP